MNRKIAVSRFAAVGLCGALVLWVAGCADERAAPVRASNPQVTARTGGNAGAGTRARAREHVVRQGETVYAIARQYGVSPHDIIAWNNLAHPDQIEAGQSLRVAPSSGGGGAVAEAIPVATEAVPVATAPVGESAPESSAPPSRVEAIAIKHEPRGGREAYSDEAWERLRVRPAATGTAEADRAEAVAASPPGTGAAASASATDAATAPPSDSAPAGSPWIWPVKGRIIAGFDAPMGGGGSKLRNRGIDIAGKPGTPVLAAGNGKVVYAGSAVRGLGKMVIIKHDDNYLTAYAHNRAILVKENDAVAQGQKIAELGSTDADQPKLHFELRNQGQPIDPLKYLPAPD
ncbi:MAG: peptidoglycan DD-metalloendopeptidase family protein [Azoarcus sp.]|jgi:lipoprotein NlpD|nr:peptidoglycan DD-metalloendopeptidase family protein [Azoarcus sp.]